MKWSLGYYYPEPTGWTYLDESLTTSEVIAWLKEHDYMTADIEISPVGNPVFSKEEFLNKFDVP